MANLALIDELITDLNNLGLEQYHWSESFEPENPFAAQLPATFGGSYVLRKKTIKRKLIPHGGQQVGVRVFSSIWRYAALKDEEKTKQLCKYLRREFRIWKECIPHPNIAGLLGFVTEVENNEFPAFLMPWYENHNLRDFLEKRKRHKEPVQMIQKYEFLLSIITGLEYLHSKNIIHRDLRGHNILVDNFEKVFLADFGSAKFLSFVIQDVSNSSEFINIQWMPPEYTTKDLTMVTDKYHDPTIAGDIWSFGCTFLEILRVGDPYPNDYPDAQTMLYAKKAPPPPSFREELSLPPTQIFFYQEECCSVNPNERISAADAVKKVTSFLADEQRKTQVS